MRIDGHAHACGEYLNTESIEKKLSKANVDMVLLTPGQYGSKITYELKNLAKKNPFGDVVSRNNRMTSIMISLIRAVKQIPKGNEYVFELKQVLSKRVKQCYWVTKDNQSRVQEDYKRMQFDTIKFHQCWEKFDISDDYFSKTVKWASKKKIPIFIHVCNIEQMAKLICFIKNNPDAIIIVGHLYGVELFMEEEKEYFKNTFFDLSNSYFVSKERTIRAYEHFGANHLLLGSDTPYGKGSLENTVQQILDLQIPNEDKERILGENLLEILSYRIL